MTARVALRTDTNVSYGESFRPKPFGSIRKSHSELSVVETEEQLYPEDHPDGQTATTNYSEKLPSSTNSDTQSAYLVSSPYLESEHQLDLATLDIQSQLLAQALTTLTSATPSFATITYQDSLNWSDVFAKLHELTSARGHQFTKQEFYVVEFRSKLKADINRPLLFKLDKESHREATASGGLLKYWFGEPDSERRNLATCLWRSKGDAILGGKGPWHKKARGITSHMYEKIEIRGLKLTIEDNVSEWRFEPWV